MRLGGAVKSRDYPCQTTNVGEVHMQKITRVVLSHTNEQRMTSANNHYINAGRQTTPCLHHGEYGPPATPRLLTVQLKWQAKPLVGIDSTFPEWLSAG